MTASPEPAAAIDVRLASFPRDRNDLRTLLTEYRAWLAAFIPEAQLCCDLPAAELADLPGQHAPPLGAFSMAFADDTPAGCAALRPITLLSGEPAAELRRMWVRPDFRGCSLGRRLATSLIEHARSLGHTSLYLDTLPAHMPAAQPLYRSLGFTPVERYGPHAGEGLAYLRLDLHPPPRT